MTLTSPYLAFKQTALQYPGNDFLHIPASARKHYATPEPLMRIDEQVARYLDAGYRAGMRVALLLENRPEFFVHLFALNPLGISVVPLNADSRPHEIAYVAEHSEIVLAVGIDMTKPLLHAALQDKVPVADVNTSALPMIESTGRSVTTPSIDDE